MHTWVRFRNIFVFILAAVHGAINFAHRKVFSERLLKFFQFLTFSGALMLFGAHVLLIAMRKVGWVSANIKYTDNFLQALNTPFTVILIFEVFLIIKAMSVSLVDSVGKQYQIVALVLMRDVLKDLSKIGDELAPGSLKMLDVMFVEMLGTIAFFLLTALFYKLKNITDAAKTRHEIEDAYIVLKRLASMGLLCGALLLGVLHVCAAVVGAIDFASFIKELSITNYLGDLLLIVILVDICLLIISSVLEDAFELIMRNGCLLISTIFTRLALTASQPEHVGFALVGMVFGLSIFGIYAMSRTTFAYHRFLRAKLESDERGIY